MTGVAGPGRRTAEKPVGLVYLHVSADGVDGGAERRFPGPRENVRDWSATAALHLVRTVAQQSRVRLTVAELFDTNVCPVSFLY